MSKRVFWSTFAFLILYNLTTLLFSAWNEGYVHDEPMYIEIGKMVLNGQRPEAGWGHPPLSIWTGAWLPWKLGFHQAFDPMTLFLSRLTHIFLNVIGGFAIAYFIFLKRGQFAALFFLTLYSTLAVLKFVTSHHLTDSDSTMLAAVALAWLWSKPPANSLNVFGPLFLLILATMSKISMVLIAPFVLLPIIIESHSSKSLLRLFVLSFILLLVALSFTYGFHLADFFQYFEILKIQLGRSGGGSPNSLLGMRIDSGVWYYYFVVGFYKSPIPWLLLLLGTLATLFRRMPDRPDLWFFLFPALAIFVVFSRSTLQLGFRYITLSILLFSIFISINLNIPKKWNSIFLVVLAVFFLGIDFYTLKTGSYQTYFNLLAPRPPINFTESNIDWHQKIPHHLESLAPISQPISNYLNFLMDPNSETETFKTTSMELNNIWHHPAGVVFRGLPPFLTIAGHEFHRVTKETLYQLLTERPPFHSSGSQTFKLWDAPMVFRPHCKPNEKFSLKSTSLFDLEKILRAVPDSELKTERKIPMAPGHIGKSLVIVESSGPVDVSIQNSGGTFPRGSLEEYRHFSYWFPFERTASIGTADLLIERRNKFPNKDITARAIQLWYECDESLTPPNTAK